MGLPKRTKQRLSWSKASLMAEIQCAPSLDGRRQPARPSGRQIMAGASAHGGRLSSWRKEGGGDVPALASSLHMLVKGGVWVVRLKARPPRALFGKAFAEIERRSGFCLGGVLQSPRSYGVRCLPLRLFSHLRRVGRSAPGSSLRLPMERGAIFPLSRRRCKRFRQFRDAVDTVPSFPEPSGGIYSYHRNVSRGLGKYFLAALQCRRHSVPT